MIANVREGSSLGESKWANQLLLCEIAQRRGDPSNPGHPASRVGL